MNKSNYDFYKDDIAVNTFSAISQTVINTIISLSLNIKSLHL